MIYHLLHLTWNIVAPGGAAPEPYERVVNGFQIWWVVVVYTSPCSPSASTSGTASGAR